MFMNSGVTKTTLNGVPIFKVVSIFTSGSRIKLIDLVSKSPIKFFSTLMHRGWARTRWPTCSAETARWSRSTPRSMSGFGPSRTRRCKILSCWRPSQLTTYTLELVLTPSLILSEISKLICTAYIPNLQLSGRFSAARNATSRLRFPASTSLRWTTETALCTRNDPRLGGGTDF